MALIVKKFGGTSVGSIERIEAVADRMVAARTRGENLVVVVSAMSGETNRLIGLAHEVQERPVPREMDVLVSTGEQVTTALLSMVASACATSTLGTSLKSLPPANPRARFSPVT